MPRPIRPRSVQGEGNLARRIRQEREYRGWSYEVLAKRMTDAGCKIQGSAIFKVEKADPPRRITVDELIALAEVFGVTVENLLTPVEVLHKDRAKKLLKEIDAADAALFDAAGGVVDAYMKYFDLAAYEPDMREFIDGHRFNHEVAQERTERVSLGSIRTADSQIIAELSKERFGEALATFYKSLIAEASDAAVQVVDYNNERCGVAGPYTDDEEDDDGEY